MLKPLDILGDGSPLNLPGAKLRYFESFFNKKEADNYFSQILNTTSWQQDKIKVYGKILDNECKPVTNAILDIWQANSFGKYNHQADLSKSRKDNNFYGYMRLLSNEKGEYNFHTILPGSYKVSKDLTRTPHIHFKVTNNKKQLTTQMYFEGNEMNNKDFLFKNTNNNSILEAVIDRSFSKLTYKFDIII